jgi:hypothetical protein
MLDSPSIHHVVDCAKQLPPAFPGTHTHREWRHVQSELSLDGLLHSCSMASADLVGFGQHDLSIEA